jgi:hypothetical protein
MQTLTGTYYNGTLRLEREIQSEKPIKVAVTFLEEPQRETNAGLSLSDFSFLEARELLKDYHGSFADEVIEERRNSV